MASQLMDCLRCLPLVGQQAYGPGGGKPGRAPSKQPAHKAPTLFGRNICPTACEDSVTMLHGEEQDAAWRRSAEDRWRAGKQQATKPAADSASWPPLPPPRDAELGLGSSPRAPSMEQGKATPTGAIVEHRSRSSLGSESTTTASMRRLRSGTGGDAPPQPHLVGFLAPRFTDERTEAEFQQWAKRRKPRWGMVVSIFGFGTSVLALLVNCWPPLDQTTWFRTGACVAGVVAFLTLGLLCRYAPYHITAGLYDPLVVLMALVFTFTGSMTADRTAAVLGLPRDGWSLVALQDANGSLFVGMVLSLMVIFARPGLRWTLACLGLAIPASAAIQIAFGSVEYDLMLAAQDGIWSHQTTVLTNAGYLVLLTSAAYMSRRSEEKNERSAFGMFFSAQLKVESQRRRLEQQKERLSAFEELSAAVEHSGPPEKSTSWTVSQRSPMQSKKLSKSSSSVLARPDTAFVPPPKSPPAPGAPPPEGVILACPELAVALSGRQTDWKRVQCIVRRIRDPAYSLREYFQDCTESFAELALFVPAPGQPKIAEPAALAQEYQKTIGALFAVYWQLRLDSDGKDSLCFGVNEDWVPMKAPSKPKAPKGRGSLASVETNTGPLGPLSKMSDEERRRAFSDNIEWKLLQDLNTLAGLEGRDANERITVLLCVTVMQGVMKVEEYLPHVLEEHAPYDGHEAGKVIMDPRTALRYVLEHCPEQLPSYQGLPQHARHGALLAATAASLDINNLVWVEAPPGHLLSGLRSVLGPSAQTSDIGLYILRWFTSLAGSDGSPLRGAEKLVLKFPPDFLTLFLSAVPHLMQLGTLSETQVVEAYLQSRWRSSGRVGQHAPTLATMRLLAMAKGDYRVVESFHTLSAADRECLELELSLTGCKGQRYAGVTSEVGGPALWLSRAPAFLQLHTLASDADSVGALRVLAEVFRAARATWPLSAELEGTTHSIALRFDGRALHEMARPAAGDIWVFLHEDSKGAVELMCASSINDLSAKGTKVRMLDFGSVLDTAQVRPDFSRPALHGRWKCVDTWGMDDFLKSMGISRLQRMAASKAPWPSWAFVQDEDHIVFTNHTAMGELQEEFIVNGPEYNAVDGYKRQIKCLATWEGESALVTMKSGPEGQFREERELRSDGLLYFKQIKLKADGSEEVAWGRTFAKEAAR